METVIDKLLDAEQDSGLASECRLASPVRLFLPTSACIPAHPPVADFTSPTMPHPRVNKCLISLVAKKLVAKGMEDVRRCRAAGTDMRRGERCTIGSGRRSARGPPAAAGCVVRLGCDGHACRTGPEQPLWGLLRRSAPRVPPLRQGLNEACFSGPSQHDCISRYGRLCLQIGANDCVWMVGIGGTLFFGSDKKKKKGGCTALRRVMGAVGCWAAGCGFGSLGGSSGLVAVLGSSGDR